MSEIINLTWFQVGLGFLALIIPAMILGYYKTGLLKKMGIAVVRLTLQLMFVGYYLEYVFKWDNPWINLAWIVIMVTASDVATTDRSEIKRLPLFVPVFIATFFGIIIIDLFFLEVVIQLSNVLAAQYAIPITGMILGNCLRSNVIGVNAFYYSLKEQRDRYHYYLANGATQSEALFPFFREALKKTANPTLASMATVGLVSLPGMMTGQILSGSSPMTAIKYQIIIFIAIFSGTIISVFLAILLSNRKVFNSYNLFDESILKK